MKYTITPPEEVVQQWINDGPPLDQPKFVAHYVATQSARWGADHELEACCDLVDNAGYPALAARMRSARRPKPLSIAEQAVQELDDAVMRGDCIATTDAMPALRKALARLAELENHEH